MMPPDQAAHVRENAWHPWMLSMHNDHVKAGHPGCFLFRMTPCEIGLCGNCEKGDHAGCGTRIRIEDPRPWDPKPEINWNLSVGGDGPYGKAAALLPNCKGWLCPCGCWRDAIPGPVPEMVTREPRPVAELPVGQLSLFGELVGA